MITEFLTWVRFLIFRKKRSEMDDELHFHLEQSIAAKVARRGVRIRCTPTGFG
jgi:hypothetical protein